MFFSLMAYIDPARIMASVTKLAAYCLLVIFSGTATLLQAQTIQPITWNVIGLDSNKPATTQLPPGVYPPDRFPVGVEVCATDNPISGYKTVFVWDETPGTNYMYLWDSGVNLNDANNTNDTPASTDLAVPTLAAGACADMYHWVQIKQVTGAYNFTRDFHIELQDAGGNPIAETPRSGSTLGTDEAREIYVEKLISQNRNTVAGYEYDGQSIPADGSGVIIVQPGQSFDLALLGQTATQGYEQIELFMTLPPDLFDVSEVTSTYSASAGTDPNATKQLYADGCGWINNPADSGYHLSQYTCTGVGKYGGKVRKNYSTKVRNITVPGGGSIDVVVQALIYDFSGSSYHYNSDYSSSTFTIKIVDGENPPDDIDPPPPLPTYNASIKKTATFNGGSNSGTFTLTVTRETDDCTNGFGTCAQNFTLTDSLPPAFRLKGNATSCSNSTTVVTAGAGSLQFADDENATVGTVCNQDKRYVQWDGTLPADVDTVIATVDFEKNPAFDFNGSIDDSDVTNCGYLSSDQENADNEGCVQVSVDSPEQFDVGVQKSVTQVTENEGDFIVTFKLEVSTLGGTNDKINVSDALPAGYTYQALVGVSGDLTFGSQNGSTLSFIYAAASTSGTATFTAIADIPSTSDTADQLASKYLNYVQLLDSTSGFPLNDLDLGNNEASAGWVPPLLQVTKSPATSTLDSSGPMETCNTTESCPTVSFDLTVKKFAGLVEGNTVRVTEAPPAGLEFTGITEAGGGSTWACTVNGNPPTYPVAEQVVCDRAVGANETPLPFAYPTLTFDGRLNPTPTTMTEFINSAFVEGYDGSILIPNTFDEDNASVTYSGEAKVKIAGTLFLDQDADGGYDGIKNGTNAATDGGGNLHACLDTSPATFSTVIGSDGQFEFTGLDQGTSYNVIIFKSDQAPSGNSCPTTSTLNDSWYSTGESVDGSTTDSTVISKQTVSDGNLAVPVVDSDVTTLTFGLTRAAIFDPPFGLKVGQILRGQAVIRWTMVWINDSPIPINGAVISDAISEGTTYVPDSLTCVAEGDSQCVSDEYDVASNQINVVANFAGETGNPTDGESAANEVIIAFDVTFDADNPLPKYENLGQLRWTPPGGTEKETTTDDPDRLGQEDPTEVVPSPDARTEPIPTLPAGLLLAMVVFFGLMGRQILLARKS